MEPKLDYVPFWWTAFECTRWHPGGKLIAWESRLKPDAQLDSPKYLISHEGPGWIHPPLSAWLVLGLLPNNRLLVECLSELGKGLRYEIPADDSRFLKAQVVESVQSV
mgnify:CR=1 FL=1